MLDVNFRATSWGFLLDFTSLRNCKRAFSDRGPWLEGNDDAQSIESSSDSSHNISGCSWVDVEEENNIGEDGVGEGGTEDVFGVVRTGRMGVDTFLSFLGGVSGESRVTKGGVESDRAAESCFLLATTSENSRLGSGGVPQTVADCELSPDWWEF